MLSNGLANLSLHSNGRNTNGRQGNSGSSSSSIPSTLERLPPELLEEIYALLSFETLCAIELVSRFLRNTVRQVGWRSWFEHNEEANVLTVLADGQERRTRRQASSLRKVSKVWLNRAFQARLVQFHELPGGKANHTGRLDANTSIPMLELHRDGLYLAIRSNVYMWPSRTLLGPHGIASKARPSSFQLNANARRSMTAWDDISAMQVINPRVIVIGRADGSLEVWLLRKDESDRPPFLTGLERGSQPSGEVQALSYLGQRALLAACWKDGTIALFHMGKIIEMTSTTKDSQLQPTCPTLSPFRSWTVDSRPWSIHLGLHSRPASETQLSPWLAVGCQGVDFLFLYRHILDQTGEVESISLRVSPGRSGRPPRLSTYALASSRGEASLDLQVFPPNHLYAGCFDGMTRVWDVEASPIRTDEDTDIAIPPRILPLQQRYIDRYDPSAIYSIVLGVGPNSHSIAIGTARHGLVKFFNVLKDSQHHKRQLDNPNEGFALYPPGVPRQIPSYAIVGEHSRIWAVGQGKVWEFDARPKARGKRGGDYSQSVAWYHHGEMTFRTTGDCGWIYE